MDDDFIPLKHKNQEVKFNSKEWKSIKKHFFITDESSKPKFTRFGDEMTFIDFFAILVPIYERIEVSGEKLLHFTSDERKFVFYSDKKDENSNYSLYVCVCDANSPVPCIIKQLKHLEYIFAKFQTNFTRLYLDYYDSSIGKVYEKYVRFVCNFNYRTARFELNKIGKNGVWVYVNNMFLMTNRFEKGDYITCSCLVQIDEDNFVNDKYKIRSRIISGNKITVIELLTDNTKLNESPDVFELLINSFERISLKEQIHSSIVSITYLKSEYAYTYFDHQRIDLNQITCLHSYYANSGENYIVDKYTVKKNRDCYVIFEIDTYPVTFDDSVQKFLSIIQRYFS